MPPFPIRSDPFPVPYPFPFPVPYSFPYPVPFPFPFPFPVPYSKLALPRNFKRGAAELPPHAV